MAEAAPAGRSHQQSPHGFLPEGVEDPAEVPRPVARWIRLTVLHHERGEADASELVEFTSGSNSCFCADDSRGDQVCSAGGVCPEPRPSARVPAAAGGDHHGPGPGGGRRRGQHRRNHPRGSNFTFGQRPFPQRSGTSADSNDC